MQKEKRIYWIITVIGMALIVFPSYFAPRAYLLETIHRLSFPAYFNLELDICKIVGAVIILIPAICRMFKEWAYVAFGILLLSASLAHWLAGWRSKYCSGNTSTELSTVRFEFLFRSLMYAYTCKAMGFELLLDWKILNWADKQKMVGKVRTKESPQI